MDETSNKEILNTLKVNHKPLYTENDITPENESWVRALMKADEIFKQLEEKDSSN